MVDEVVFSFVFSFAKLAPVGRFDRFLRFNPSIWLDVVHAKTARTVRLVLVDFLPSFEHLAAVWTPFCVVVEVFG